MIKMRQQQGVALVTSLILLVVMAVVGITAMNRGILQGQMAFTHDEATMTFQAAEASIEAVLHEQETTVLDETGKALNIAREAGQFPDDFAEPLTCADPNDLFVERRLDNTGLQASAAHAAAPEASLADDVPITSWSKTVFLGQDPYLNVGGTSETVDSDVTFHAFMIRGCGRLAENPVVQVNQMAVSLLGPRDN